MQAIFPGIQSAVNLHPMVVHFPIVFWTVATILWSLSLLKRSEELWTLGLWFHVAGALTGLLAVALGYWATSIMGHSAPGHGLVHVHRDIMKGATVLSVLLASVAVWQRGRANASRALQIAFWGASVLQAATMAIGSDRGAVLVYQNGTGVEMKTHIDSTPETATSHQH